MVHERPFSQHGRERNSYPSVLAAKDGGVLFLKAYGLASKRYAFPNKTDTKFNIGSLKKFFTAVAVAQLLEKKDFAGALFLQRTAEDPLCLSGHNGDRGGSFCEWRPADFRRSISDWLGLIFPVSKRSGYFI